MKYLVATLLLGFLQARSLPAIAQIEIANAIDIGYPQMTNGNNLKNTYGQIASGLRFGVSYKSQDVHFFPTLYYSLGLERLPVKQINNNAVALDLGYQNLLINMNIIFPQGERGNEIYLIGGLGGVKLHPKDLYVGGPGGQTMRVTQDSTKNIQQYFPALEIGLEYVYGAATNPNVYISMGVNLEYIYLLPNQNAYYTTVTDNKGNNTSVNGALTGNAVIPTFSLCLHYLLNKNLMFWRKKDPYFL